MGAVTSAIGVDIGTTNTKVVLVGDRDTLLAAEPTPTTLDALITLVGRALSRADVPVAAVGIAAMAESGFVLDADGHARTPLLSWRDARDDADMQAFARRTGADDLFEATGVRPGPKPPMALWLSLRAHRPDLLGKVNSWAGVADALAMALTGRLVTDHTLAGRTMAYRLPPSGETLAKTFDEPLLAEAGLRLHQLPSVVLPGDPPARLTRSAAAWTGLAPGTPVWVAGHDHQVAAWGAGVRAPGQVADSVGTAEAVLHLVRGVPDRSAVRREGMSVVRAVDGATEALLAGTSFAGGFLQWLADRQTDGDVAALLAQVPGLDDVAPGSERSAHSGSGSPPQSALNPTRTVEPSAFARPGWLLPYPGGRQCPDPDPSAVVRVVGEATAPLGVRAIEAVAYQAAWIVQRQGELAGDWVDGLHMIGAALHRCSQWARIKATLAGSRTTLLRDSEPVATAAARLALFRCGLADDAALPAAPVLPVHDLIEVYQRRLDAFISSARRDD